MQIIVVDDSPSVRARIVTLCSEIPGVEVIGEAEDGLEATRVIRELDPNLVVLDIRLPLGSGIDVLRNIRKSNPAVRCIILTNYPFEQYREKALSLGAAHFFDKSTEFETLAEVIRKMAEEDPEATVDSAENGNAART